MNDLHYQEIDHRIRDEITDLDRVVSRTLKVWEKAIITGEDQDAFLDSVAINLHSFYSGLERYLN